MINIIEFINKESLTLSSVNAIKDSDIIILYSFDFKKIKDLVNESTEILIIEDIFNINLNDDISTNDPIEGNVSEINFFKFSNLNIKACELAISKSFNGKNVSLIDNKYLKFGFSNLIYQISSKYSKKLDIKIYPTVSPVNYSSSIVGAPLDDVAVINFANYLIPLSEFEKKIENSIKANFILAINNPISNIELFNKFNEIALRNLPNDTIVAIVNLDDDSKKIIQLDDLNQKDINESSLIILGNKTTYEEDGLMITPLSYVIKNEIISYTDEFFKRYLNNESPCGLDYDCEYLPCHKELEVCDFCYCPFYPCGESSTGGKWIKDKNIWDCQNCIWIHKEKTTKCIRKRIDNVLKEVDDLNFKKEELLRVRRECLLNSK